MKRRNSVQAQNERSKESILEVAYEFRAKRNLPKPLIELFEEKGIDTNRSILVWHDTMPFGGPTEAFRGEWVTPNKEFYYYEVYLDPNEQYVTDILEWENVTSKVEISQHNKGNGKTTGWLCLEVLNELNS